ncbi:hypothetical protein AMELA_G00211300, partial [Ameiurus melas]
MSNTHPNSSTLIPDVQEVRNVSVELLPLNPWDVVLCVTGTLVCCENALVLALIAHTPSLRAQTFALVASLASADLLAGLSLILNFVVIYMTDTDIV